MNLSTHTCYPETFIDAGTFQWSTELLARDGSQVARFNGDADSYDAARDAAHAAVMAVESDYILEDV